MTATQVKPKKVKSRNKDELFEILESFGVESAEFYNYVKPFLVKNVKKFCYSGYDGQDDFLVNDCYLSFVKAYKGYYKIVGGDKVFIPPYFSREKCSHPINFLITLCRNQCTLYDYHHRKQQMELEKNDRLADQLQNSIETDLDYFSYSFENFIFETSFQEHLNDIFRLRPANNVLFNFVKWEILSNTENNQSPTSYYFGGSNN